MAKNSSIDWTETTWNPITGCTKVSSGCKNCYAEKMTKRLVAMGQHNYRNGFQVTCHSEMLSKPFEWKRPSLIFVNSMSDLFHEDVPMEFIGAVFATMNATPHHTYQVVLTKRPERMAQLSWRLNWTPNIWAGVSVENNDCIGRVAILRTIPATVRFLSLEPLLGPLPRLDLTHIDWVIVGGESGPGARPMDPGWVRDIRETCLQTETPFFFKQWGGVRKKEVGRILDGQTWDQMPTLTFD